MFGLSFLAETNNNQQTKSASLFQLTTDVRASGDLERRETGVQKEREPNFGPVFQFQYGQKLKSKYHLFT